MRCVTFWGCIDRPGKKQKQCHRYTNTRAHSQTTNTLNYTPNYTPFTTAYFRYLLVSTAHKIFFFLCFHFQTSSEFGCTPITPLTSVFPPFLLRHSTDPNSSYLSPLLNLGCPRTLSPVIHFFIRILSSDIAVTYLNHWLSYPISILLYCLQSFIYFRISLFVLYFVYFCPYALQKPHFCRLILRLSLSIKIQASQV